MKNNDDPREALFRKINRKTKKNVAEAAENRKRGVPNWRESGDYNFWQGLNQSQRKWEFLRRSDDYWSDWLRYEKAKEGKTQAALGQILAETYGLKELVKPTIKGKDFTAKFSAIMAKGCEDYPIIEESESFLRSIGCRAPMEPETAWQKEMSTLADEMGTARDDPYGLIVTVKFNLEYSAIKQADFIYKRLQQMQKVRKRLMAELKLPKGQKYENDDYSPIEIRERNRRGNEKARDKKIEQDNHVLLLRVLDAANCRLTQEAIAEGLTEDGTLTKASWDTSTISRKVPYAKNLWRQM